MPGMVREWLVCFFRSKSHTAHNVQPAHNPRGPSGGMRLPSFPKRRCLLFPATNTSPLACRGRRHFFSRVTAGRAASSGRAFVSWGSPLGGIHTEYPPLLHANLASLKLVFSLFCTWHMQIWSPRLAPWLCLQSWPGPTRGGVPPPVQVNGTFPEH